MERHNSFGVVFACVHGCTHPCRYTHLCRYSHPCRYAEDSTVLVICLETGSLTESAAYSFWLCWKPGSLSNPSVSSFLPRLGLQACIATSGFLCGCWGPQLRSSCLHRKRSHPLSHFCSPGKRKILNFPPPTPLLSSHNWSPLLLRASWYL